MFITPAPKYKMPSSGLHRNLHTHMYIHFLGYTHVRIMKQFYKTYRFTVLLRKGEGENIKMKQGTQNKASSSQESRLWDMHLSRADEIRMSLSNTGEGLGFTNDMFLITAVKVVSSTGNP